MSKQLLHNEATRVFDELKLVGFRVQCSGEQYINEIPKASIRLNERISEIKYVTKPSLQFGAFVVDSCSKEDGYWVCVEVQKYEDIPDDMVSLTIPSQRYAVLRYKGPNYRIKDTYTNLHQWIEQNKYKRLKDKWHLEIFYSFRDTENVDVELLDTIE
jgi:predicted transcriptional regulator YdeE